ncbi:MAG: DegT/DnrJ/EryC1/StrS family aminotransferase [Acidimicrobiales bacterium]
MSDIPLNNIHAQRDVIGDEIDEAIARVIAHGRYIMGPEVAEFEAAMAAQVGDDNVQAIACANGTDALVLAYHALGLQPGDAVICPSFTFVATAEAVAALGGVPVFADVEDGGYNLSAASVRRAAKMATARGMTVRGICAVDLFGLPASYGSLQEVASELGCWLVADAAQSFGASVDGQRVGSLASVTTTSFFPAKPLGCYGDGGMVFTTDGAIADRLRSLRIHGKGSDKYDNVEVGYNSRLDTLQAAVLLPKLRQLEEEVAARQRIAERYSAGLADAVTAPLVPAGYRSAWAQYTIVTEVRDEVQSALTAAGIGSAIYYPKPLHQQTGYSHFDSADSELDRTEWLTPRVLSLPMFPYLEDSEIDRVVETVRSVVDAST